MALESATGGDAMPNGVLHERLEQQRRDPRVHRLGVEVPLDTQPVLEARALDVQVQLGEPHLATKRHERIIRQLERRPQEAAERLVEEAREIQRREASRIVTPGEMPIPGIKGPGGGGIIS